jgi:hypothetical protein
MDNKYKENFIIMKKERREKKRTTKRSISGEEVIYIFEKVLEGWKTIKIYNTIIQNNHNSTILKKNVENISTGNTKVLKIELTEERYNYYLQLRQKVYQYHINRKELKKKNKLDNNINLSKKSIDKELFTGEKCSEVNIII